MRLDSRTTAAPVTRRAAAYLSGAGVSSSFGLLREELSAVPGGAWARSTRSVCARAPSLTLVHDPAVRRAGDKMFDGVIPLVQALRPLNLSRPSTRTCRQQQ